MAAVQLDGRALAHAAPGMKEDREVVSAAVGESWPFEGVPEEMKGGREIVQAAVQTLRSYGLSDDEISSCLVIDISVPAGVVDEAFIK